MQPQINRIKINQSYSPQKHTRPHSIQKKRQSQTILTSLLACPICKDKIKNSHMCPHCSKLFCENCIKNWVVTKKSQCPNCSYNLRLTLIVNCSQLGKQLEEAISVMNTEGQEVTEGITQQLCIPQTQNYLTSEATSPRMNELLCKQHQNKLQYYCETCQKGICSDCAVLTETHRYHKLCKLSQKRRSFLQEVENIIKRIGSHRQTLLRGKQEGEEVIEKIKEKQSIHLTQLQVYVKRLINELAKKSQAVIKQKENVCNELFKTNIEEAAKYDVFLNCLKISAKGVLIKNFKNMQKEISEYLGMDRGQQNYFQTQITSSITPEYEQKTFILDNYSHMKEKKDILYSEVFFWRGIQWRLKIYPGGLQEQGSENNFDQYLAIYLEMSKGHKQHLNTYEFKIQLINQEERSKKISRVYKDEFEQGLCWGYDKFTKISTLYEQKYVHPHQDYLQIVLRVKSPAYYHAVSDQNHRIDTKVKILESNLQKIRQLRKQLGNNSIIPGKNDKNSRTVQALIDEGEVQKSPIRRIKSNYDLTQKQQF